ncbi:hypothetical protein [Parerythrobacter aestuarii]|uniref:hypothetical protein n=1 Tax=Parerythrobacter aestuarii TaxID=3020909 RepID=UPI0024DE5C61|nr:hypothetical protein [Parerythrobacter aestuarii]
MKFGKLAAAAGALSLAAAPIAAQADMSRIAAPVAGESENGGGAAGGILAAFAILAIVIGVAAGDESPTSS